MLLAGEPGVGKSTSTSALVSVLRARGQVEEPLFPGALGALAEIEAQGWLLGVATGKSDRGLRHCLERHGIHGRFMTLQTADRHPSKPHPSMLDAARDAVGAGEVAMIGDTTFDISMALAASADPIGVGWGYHAPAALAGAGARVIAQRFADLPAIMER